MNCINNNIISCEIVELHNKADKIGNNLQTISYQIQNH